MSLLDVTDLEMRFGERLIQRNVTLSVEKGSIVAIMEEAAAERVPC